MITDNSMNNNVSIRVDGYYAADNMGGEITSHNGGAMYFAGAGDGSTYLGEADVINDIRHDIIVTGSTASNLRSIANASNLYCLG